MQKKNSCIQKENLLLSLKNWLHTNIEKSIKLNRV